MSIKKTFLLEDTIMQWADRQDSSWLRIPVNYDIRGPGGEIFCLMTDDVSKLLRKARENAMIEEIPQPLARRIAGVLQSHWHGHIGFKEANERIAHWYKEWLNE